MQCTFRLLILLNTLVYQFYHKLSFLFKKKVPGTDLRYHCFYEPNSWFVLVRQKQIFIYYYYLISIYFLSLSNPQYTRTSNEFKLYYLIFSERRRMTDKKQSKRANNKGRCSNRWFNKTTSWQCKRDLHYLW